MLETIDLARAPRQGLAPARPPDRGAAAVGRDRPADQGRRSTSASARCCCASRWRRSRSELGEGEEGKAQEIAELERGDRQGRHAGGGRGPGAQGAAPAAAHARGRGRVRHDPHLSRLADRAAVGAARAKRRSTSPRRAASSTRTTTASTRSSGASSSIWRCASSRREGKAPILCFVGPPGVGKTSLGQSIARAMGRKFVRVSLGGVHDEAEIRGHRRTYIGALPGNIIQAIRKAGARDCVMMLDEIDKLGAGIQGDPARGAARGARSRAEQHLPRQLPRRAVRPQPRGVHRHRQHARHHPRAAARPHGDHQPRRLHGRARSSQIAQRYLVRAPARGQRAEGRSRSRSTDAALRDIIQRLHARGRRAQPRARDRPGAAPCRGARSPKGRAATIRIDAGDLADDPRARRGSRTRSRCAPACPASPPASPGRRSAATSCSSRRRASPGSGKLILTGQLGDVMKESAQAALSLVKNRAGDARHRSRRCFEKSDIHVHVPAGATPKDGPSAGVAMFMALASLMTDRTIRSDTAMTGEISLRGLVLPVGGIKEKVVAAARAGHQARHAAGAQPQGLRRHPRGGARAARVRLAGAGRRRGGGGAGAGRCRVAHDARPRRELFRAEA